MPKIIGLNPRRNPIKQFLVFCANVNADSVKMGRNNGISSEQNMNKKVAQDWFLF
jgi:hypothetical protein